ncbi:MAG: cell division protein FtsZ [Bifidobacteriaceae bacterium]|nr:cell division protein FtsZ [Bifidobacteriaceae bacterium]
MAAPQNYLAVIKVVGIGGGGVNAVNRMKEVGLKGVEFVAINTDAQALLMSDADVKLDIGRESTRGLGAGADPEVGRRSAEEHADEIREVLDGADMVFVAAGEGGGTGTGGAPVVARIARELDALTVGVVTRPFAFEGRRRENQAIDGIDKLREEVDTLIVIPNERLMQISDPGMSILEAFRSADQVLLSGVQGITDLITTPGLINVDFADVESVMKGAGSALMGIGAARGEDRTVRAAEMAISSPLLEASIDGAHGVLLCIQSASDIGLDEVNRGASLVSEAVHPEANIIFGQIIDDALADEVRVTVIAAGFDVQDPKPYTAELRAVKPRAVRPVTGTAPSGAIPAAPAVAPLVPAPSIAPAYEVPSRERQAAPDSEEEAPDSLPPALPVPPRGPVPSGESPTVPRIPRAAIPATGLFGQSDPSIQSLVKPAGTDDPTEQVPLDSTPLFDSGHRTSRTGREVAQPEPPSKDDIVVPSWLNED